MKLILNQTALFAVFSAVIGMTTIQGQTPIPSTFALPSSAADASKPGFVWRTHASGGGLPDTLARLESQLAGLLGDNYADLNAVGPALAPAAPANPSTAPVTFEIPTVINLNQVEGGAGNFDTDSILPGIPPTVGVSDGIAGEALTWLDLPAGTITMGVNSDDGFRVSIGGAAPQDKFNNINVGQFDGGRGAADTVFTFTISQAGLYSARLIWEEGGGDANVEWFTQAADGTKTLVNDVGGIKAYRAVTTPPAKAYVRTAIPLPGFAGVAPNGSVKAEVVDGAAPIDPTTVKLTLDGTALPDAGAKVGNATTISFTPTTPYASASQHTVVLTYTESGNVVTQSWTFAVPAYVTIAPGSKVTPDTSKPGFVWNIFQNDANQETSNARAAAALAGQLKDDTGAALPNLADPATIGVALAAASAASPANAPLRFEIATVINLAQDSTDSAANANGNFTPDQQMPGVPPGDVNGIAAEAITYLELPAGLVAMGVNSDDGFQTTLGIDAIRSPLLGAFDAGRGASDTIFYFFVQEAGVYPFRTLWEEGGGGANIEWFTVKTDGTKVLVNDTAKGGLKAYRALSGTQNPYVKYVSPGTEPRQLNKVGSTVTIVIVDGTNPVDLNSVALKIDGQDVTTAKTRVGATVQAIYTPTTLQIPGDIHTAALTYKDSTGGFTGNPQWQFRNLKNLVLPTPKITENFDSYPEDTQPTGWVATNFSSHDTTGRDITNQKSESYENWVLVSTDNMTGLDGGSANVAPGQTFNGQPVTSIASGNVLYAESDGRANADTDPFVGRGYAGQAQFIVSKAFDCSQIPNVAITLSALYTQNQDSIGAIEYSVDGSNTWLPVAYFIDIIDGGGDVKYNADGSVDAVATFTSANADTANWVVNGVAKGDNYGDGIAAPITAALGDYVAPRLNDNQFEAARIEVFRLAQAGGKSDVRLRFAQLGTDSWWFAIDNLAFYDVAGAVQPPPEQPKVTGQWDFDQGDLRATVGQDMQYGDGPTGLVKDHTSYGTTTSFGIPDIGGKPAKVMKFTRIEDSEYPDPADKNPRGYLTPHGMAPNGVAPDGAVGTKVNQFTMIVDMMNPDLHLGNGYNTVVKWEDVDDITRDGSISIRANDIGGDNTGGIGISGQYTGDGVTWIIGGQWQRIVVAVDMAAETPIINYYIDGVKFGQMTSGDRWGFDNRHAIPPVVRLYADGENDNEVNTYYVNSVQFRNSTLTEAEAAALGAASADGIPNPNASPPPPAGPTISIARSGTSLTLSWPASDTGFTLESADSLSNPTWTAVSGVANNSVTVQIGAGSKFYRLRK